MRIATLFCLVIVTSALSQAKERKFLDGYSGQSTEQLIALASDHRIDSLVLAFEQALDQKRAKKSKLTQTEIDILAIEAMEREVNNGGFNQFFLNSSKVYAATLSASLDRIGCPVAAKIATDAVSFLKIEGAVTEMKIDAALNLLGNKAVEHFREIDGRYFRNDEAIADRLFAYIKAKKAEIVLK